LVEDHAACLSITYSTLMIIGGRSCSMLVNHVQYPNDYWWKIM